MTEIQQEAEKFSLFIDMRNKKRNRHDHDDDNYFDIIDRDIPDIYSDTSEIDSSAVRSLHPKVPLLSSVSGGKRLRNVKNHPASANQQITVSVDYSTRSATALSYPSSSSSDSTDSDISTLSSNNSEIPPNDDRHRSKYDEKSIERKDKTTSNGMKKGRNNSGISLSSSPPPATGTGKKFEEIKVEMKFWNDEQQPETSVDDSDTESIEDVTTISTDRDFSSLNCSKTYYSTSSPSSSSASSATSDRTYLISRNVYTLSPEHQSSAVAADVVSDYGRLTVLDEVNDNSNYDYNRNGFNNYNQNNSNNHSSCNIHNNNNNNNNNNSNNNAVYKFGSKALDWNNGRTDMKNFEYDLNSPADDYYSVCCNVERGDFNNSTEMANAFDGDTEKSRSVKTDDSVRQHNTTVRSFESNEGRSELTDKSFNSSWNSHDNNDRYKYNDNSNNNTSTANNNNNHIINNNNHINNNNNNNNNKMCYEDVVQKVISNYRNKSLFKKTIDEHDDETDKNIRPVCRQNSWEQPSSSGLNNLKKIINNNDLNYLYDDNFPVVKNKLTVVQNDTVSSKKIIINKNNNNGSSNNSSWDGKLTTFGSSSDNKWTTTIIENDVRNLIGGSNGKTTGVSDDENRANKSTVVDDFRRSTIDERKVLIILEPPELFRDQNSDQPAGTGSQTSPPKSSGHCRAPLLLPENSALNNNNNNKNEEIEKQGIDHSFCADHQREKEHLYDDIVTEDYDEEDKGIEHVRISSTSGAGDNDDDDVDDEEQLVDGEEGGGVNSSLAALPTTTTATVDAKSIDGGFAFISSDAWKRLRLDAAAAMQTLSSLCDSVSITNDVDIRCKLNFQEVDMNDYDNNHEGVCISISSGNNNSNSNSNKMDVDKEAVAEKGAAAVIRRNKNVSLYDLCFRSAQAHVVAYQQRPRPQLNGNHIAASSSSTSPGGYTLKRCSDVNWLRLITTVATVQPDQHQQEQQQPSVSLPWKYVSLFRVDDLESSVRSRNNFHLVNDYKNNNNNDLLTIFCCSKCDDLKSDAVIYALPLSIPIRTESKSLLLSEYLITSSLDCFSFANNSLSNDELLNNYYSPPSESPSSSLEDNNDIMKSKSKKDNSKSSESSSAVGGSSINVDEQQQKAPNGILKSALKRTNSSSSSSSKRFGSGGGNKKKHRVQFNESLNKSFEADYVILVRDEDYEEEAEDIEDIEDEEFISCDCGSQFCYDSCYYLEDHHHHHHHEQQHHHHHQSDLYEDDVVIDRSDAASSRPSCRFDGQDAAASSRPSCRFDGQDAAASSRPSCRFDGQDAAASSRPSCRFDGRGGFSLESPKFDHLCPSTIPFEPPFEFVDHLTLSPPDGYKDGCGGMQTSSSSSSNNEIKAVTTSTMTATDDFFEDSSSSIDDKGTPTTTNNLEKQARGGRFHYGGNRENQDSRLSNDNNIVTSVAADNKSKDTSNETINNKLANTNRSTSLLNEHYHHKDGHIASQQQQYIVETVTMTRVMERRVITESSEKNPSVDEIAIRSSSTPSSLSLSLSQQESADKDRRQQQQQLVGGILKGGKLWKSSTVDAASNGGNNNNNVIIEEEEGEGEGEEELDANNGRKDTSPTDKRTVKFSSNTDHDSSPVCTCSNSIERCPSNMEYTLTFRLGNRIVPTNSLKPNSAVRQLFPDSKFVPPPNSADNNDNNNNNNNNNNNGNEDGNELGKCEGKYLVTEESLRAFNEVNKKSFVFGASSSSLLKGKEIYPYKGGEGGSINYDTENDDDLENSLLLRRTIQRGTLRRSLMRNSGAARKKMISDMEKSPENISLEERIKQLTMVDDEDTTTITVAASSSELLDSGTTSLDVDGGATTTERCSSFANTNIHGADQKQIHRHHIKGSVVIKPTTKSSSSTGGVTSAYRKFADLFSRKTEITVSTTTEQHYPYYQPVYQCNNNSNSSIAAATDLTTANDGGNNKSIGGNNANEARKQFLSTLAPLKTCVSASTSASASARDESDSRPDSGAKLLLSGDRNSVASVASSVGTEYSLSDIDQVLGGNNNNSNCTAEVKPTAQPPDVIAGTPNGNNNNGNSNAENQDELAMFVQRDAGRIERIKKRYSVTPSTAAATGSDDDEHDDYGFSRRPSVKGIKPRFGSTTEILQQMQEQLQPPPLACSAKAGSHMTWPYYSSGVVECVNNNNNRATNLLATNNNNTVSASSKIKQHDHHPSYHCNRTSCPTEYTARVTWEPCTSTMQPARLHTYSPTASIGGGMVSTPLIGAFTTSATNMPYRFAPPTIASSSASSSVDYQTSEEGGGTTPQCTPQYVRKIGNNSYVQMKVSPLTVGSQIPLVGGVGSACTNTDDFPNHLPTTTGGGTGTTTSIIRVGHGQQQTFRVPCPVSGPVQVHLLATHRCDKASSSLFRNSSSPTGPPPTTGQHQNHNHLLHHHHHHNHHQQMVIARGTQTSVAVPAAAATECSDVNYGYHYHQNVINFNNPVLATTPKTVHIMYNNNNNNNVLPPQQQQQQQTSSPVTSLTSSPTRIKIPVHNAAGGQLVERGIPEGASSSPAFVQDASGSSSSYNIVPPSPITVPPGNANAHKNIDNASLLPPSNAPAKPLTPSYGMRL